MTIFNVTVIGATRGTGKEVALRLLQAPTKFHVTILCRSATRLDYDTAGSTIITGDASNQHDVETAIQNANVVISALGATNTTPFQKVDLLTHYADVLVTAAERLPVPPRLIFVSAMGTGESIWTVPLLLQVVCRTVIANKMEDKFGMEERVGKYKGEWVCVRPGMLTDGEETGIYRVGEAPLNGWSIGRKDLADFILKCVEGDEWDGKKPVVVY
ncbi:NAD(P)-binding protein [Rhizoclosmatium globosum]|uniref:NAD(P)-binding protein n=1 Tax=Rhizoclosmatium globosum TaxID=329046 RepID=A0A1Y2BSP8_9FUNG|nr:NAD(P)-binding protein [Rhizoclosmatium globosum]|eukprot:ORY37780.1 NAD(P)-binding protein [Rhizoclosmatium globosum]